MTIPSSLSALRAPVLLPVRAGLLAAIVSAACAAQAQTSVPAGTPALTTPPAPPVNTVEVTGATSAYDPRRDDTASKIVVNHDEIVKYGDTNVLDVLKRVPGVTVTGSGRQGGEIRMRGLGSGYTQVLINGERAPAGFSMDALAPDVIERIEVLRAASAEYSTQSIAGTINIVLRKAVSARQRELKVGYSGGDGMRAQNANLQLADKRGRMSYSLAVNLMDNRFDRDSPTLDESTGALEPERYRRLSDPRDDGVFKALNVGPRLNWNLENGDTVTSQSFIHVNRFERTGVEHIDSTGAPPPYPDNSMASHSDGHTVRSDLTWTHKLGDGAKLDLKLGGTFFANASSLHRTGSGRAEAPALDSTLATDTTDKGLSSTGKYSGPLGEGHALGVGWDGGYSRRDETRTEFDLQRAQAHVGRLALYAQDEWSTTKLLSIYLGARWEGIETVSSGSDFARSTSRLSVWSPLMQVLYKLPDSKADQLRFALTRTFKAPNARQLVPHNSPSTNNSEVDPDYEGNPDLRPEQATGIDASYEHYWPQGGVFSVALSARHISGFIREAVVEETPAHWVARPVNDGEATTRSLEVEAKFPVRIFLPHGPDLDLRANVSRNWSRVAAVPGPDNRLDGQTPLSATFGADYKVGALTAGGSFVFRSGGPVRVSLAQSSYETVRRDVDVYVLWKFSPKNQLRFTASNLLAQDWISESRYVDAGADTHRRIVYPGTMVGHLQWETKF